jgi:GT2 family glycosyltransferase
MSSQCEEACGVTDNPAAKGRVFQRIAVVVLNLCNERDTAACVESLKRSDYPACEIILVDNGSPDGSGERLRESFPDLTFIKSAENIGFTGGNNLAIERALADGFEYVLLLNNDATVDADCISQLVGTAESQPRVGAVGAKILYFDAPDRIWFGGGNISRMRVAGLHRREGEFDEHHVAESLEEVSFLTGCCLLIPATVLREVGGLRPDLFAYLEDVEFSMRVSSAGYRLYYQPWARVYHRVPVVPGQPTPKKIVLRDRNRRRVARAQLKGLEKLRFSLFFYPTRVVLGLRYLLKGDRQRGAAIWRGMTEP